MMYKKLVVTALSLAFSGLALAADFKAGEDYIVTGVTTSNTNAKVQVSEYFGYWCPHCNNFEPMLEKWVEEKSGDIAFDRVPVAFSTRGQNQTLAQKAYYVGKQTNTQKAVDEAMFSFYHKYGRIAPSFKNLDTIQNDPVACNAQLHKLVDNAQKQSESSNRPFDVASVTQYLTETVCEADEKGWAMLKVAKAARGGIRDQDTLKGILSAAGVDTNNFDKRLESFSMTSAMKSAAKKADAMGIDSVPTLVVNDKYRVTSAKGFDHMLAVVEFLIAKEQESK